MNPLRKLISAVAAAMIAAPAAAAPLGLVLGVEGNVEPAIGAFEEIDAPSTFRLADGASFQFVHYRTCQDLTIRGGTLNVSKKGYVVDGGETVASVDKPCPKRQRLKEDALLSGVLLRSGGGGVAVGDQPSFVLVGAGAARVAAIEFQHRDGGAPARFRVTARRFAYPSDATALPSGEAVLVRLLDAAGMSLGGLAVSPKADETGRDLLLVID